MSEHRFCSRPVVAREAPGDGGRGIRVVRQWLGTAGDIFGITGRDRRTFLYSFAAITVIVGAVNIINVETLAHEKPQIGLVGPMIWEGSSWLTLLLFLWIPWVAWRAAPPLAWPRWKLAIHPFAVVAFSLAHVAGFVAIRKLAYRLLGAHYEFGAFFSHFRYELGKDSFGYLVFIGAFTLIDHLSRPVSPVKTSDPAPVFDIRDGAKFTRVRLDDVLAIASAGNYVEFVLCDARRLLMRSSLANLEAEFSPRGFLRTHRSWIINTRHVTGLEPEGSGDYSIKLGSLSVPLSRRFPAALARLKEPPT